MNILFVSGQFANNERDTLLGGMAYAVYKSALGMQRYGHKVKILAISNRNKRWFYHGLEVISVKTYQWADSNKMGTVLIGTMKREFCIEMTIKKLNKEETIDIIQYTGWNGIGLFHNNTIPAIMRISSYTKVQFEYNYSNVLKKTLESMEYLAAKRMNYIFAPSKLMANGIKKEIGKNVAIIETPFLFEEIEWNENILKKKLMGKKYIFYFGRMSVDKGILVIRDLLYKVLDTYKDLYFVFAGGGPEYHGNSIEIELLKASKEYKNRLIFLGWLSKSKLLPIIFNAEMVLMPSLSDNFPNSCAEAMALGQIVIGTNGSSLEQFIKNGENGFLSEIGNAESLYYYINQVLKLDEKEKERISKMAQEKIRKLNLEDYSKKMELLYSKIIEYIKIQKDAKIFFNANKRTNKEGFRIASIFKNMKNIKREFVLKNSIL